MFEFKRDLRKEREDAEAQLDKYLRDREKAVGRRFIGIATDGAEFALYELRRNKLTLRRNRFDVAAELRRYKNNSVEAAHGLAAWLSPLLSQRPELPPDPATIRRELGRESIAYEIAQGRLEELWEAVRDDSEVKVKREVWAERLSRVYGTRIESDALFIQHTYLTLAAKTMATLVLGGDDRRQRRICSRASRFRTPESRAWLSRISSIGCWRRRKAAKLSARSVRKWCGCGSAISSTTF